MSLIIGEAEFYERVRVTLLRDAPLDAGCVAGPGRSGAIAAVYVSHLLGIPFVPFGETAGPDKPVLIVDTAAASGATMRSAVRRYEKKGVPVRCFGAFFNEPPRVKFWYERGVPRA